MTPDAPDPEPVYERFTVRYPSGTVFDSHCPGGATLREVELEHPLAQVEAVEDSLADPTVTHERADSHHPQEQPGRDPRQVVGVQGASLNLDIRVYTEIEDKADKVPTKKGVTLRPDLIPELMGHWRARSVTAHRPSPPNLHDDRHPATSAFQILFRTTRYPCTIQRPRCAKGASTAGITRLAGRSRG